jgi:hypothetical protein
MSPRSSTGTSLRPSWGAVASNLVEGVADDIQLAVEILCELDAFEIVTPSGV